MRDDTLARERRAEIRSADDVCTCGWRESRGAVAIYARASSPEILIEVAHDGRTRLGSFVSSRREGATRLTRRELQLARRFARLLRA